MNELTCQEIDESLAAYAMDALESDETVALEHHLVECRLHDAELADLRSVTDRLPTLLNAEAPSPRVRNGLLEAFDSAVGVPASPAMASRPQPIRPARRGLLAMPSFGYALAAALAIFAAGLGVWGLSRGNDTAPSGIVVRSIDEGGQHVDFVYVPERQLALISVDLPQISSDRAYQLWQITEGGPVSMGLIQPGTVTAMEIDLSGASAIAITVEPAGGSPAPTSAPILVSEL